VGTFGGGDVRSGGEVEPRICPSVGQISCGAAVEGPSASERTLGASGICDAVPVVDLRGSGPLSLTDELGSVLDCPAEGSEGTVGDYAYLISPPAAVGMDSCDRRYASDGSFLCPFSGEYLCEEVWYRSQISTEDMPRWCGSLGRFISDMRLSTYIVRCS